MITSRCRSVILAAPLFRSRCGQGTAERSYPPYTLGRNAGRILADVLVGVDQVQLAAPAGCEEEARRFFGELLGLEELEKPQALSARGGVWFRVGGQQLHIGVDDDFTPARKAHPAFTVTGYDELLDRLRAAGVEVVEDEAIPGVRRSFVADPWGNRLELVSGE